MTYKKQWITATTFVFFGITAARAENPPCYTLASLQGSWSIVTTYSQTPARAFGQRYIDINGNMTGVFVLNGPASNSTPGTLTLTRSTGTQRGTYTVNCDGTGTVTRVVTSSTGVVSNQVDDFIITTAVVKNGQFVATAIVDIEQLPSPLIPGGALVTRQYNRLPDRPGPTEP